METSMTLRHFVEKTSDQLIISVPTSRHTKQMYKDKLWEAARLAGYEGIQDADSFFAIALKPEGFQVKELGIRGGNWNEYVRTGEN